jgi:uncharacterized protein YggE
MTLMQSPTQPPRPQHGGRASHRSRQRSRAPHRVVPRALRLALLSLVLLAGPSWADVNTGIHVNGRGTIEVAPDMGYVRLHARREGNDAEVLKAALDEVVREVLRLTRRLDIEERDVTATAVTINPRYRRRDNESVVDGLIAVRTISITLRDLDRFGDLLNESLALGINNLDPIRMDSSRREDLENEALALAMVDAQQEATRVAEGFSVTLGSVTDVHVGAHSVRPTERVMATAAMRDGGGDFSPGLLRIERSIQATFAILGSD